MDEIELFQKIQTIEESMTLHYVVTPQSLPAMRLELKIHSELLGVELKLTFRRGSQGLLNRIHIIRA